MVKFNKIKKPLFASPQTHNNKQQQNNDYFNKISEKFKQNNLNLGNNNSNEISSYSNNLNLNKNNFKSLTPNIKNDLKNSPNNLKKGLFKNHLKFLIKNKKKKKEPGNFKSQNKAVKYFEELKLKKKKKIIKNKKKNNEQNVIPKNKNKNEFKSIKNDKIKVNSNNKISKKKNLNNKLLFCDLIKEFNNKDIFNYDLLKTIDIDYLLIHCTKLLQMFCKINNREFICNSIKNYSEIIQNNNYIIYENIVYQNPKYNNLLSCFKFELWIVLFIFYFSLNEKKFIKMKEFCKKGIKIICQNNFIFLKILSNSFKDKKIDNKHKIIDNFLKETNMLKVFKLNKPFKNFINYNLDSLKEMIKKIKKSIPIQIEEKSNNFINIYERLNLNDSADYIFDSFYKILEKKGIICLNEENVLKEINLNQLKDDLSHKTDITQKGEKKKKTNKETNEDCKTINSKSMKKDEESIEIDEYFIIQPDQNINKNEYYLPKNSSGKKYTLVLDLDETLIHYVEYEKGGEFLIRPFAIEFLKEMHEYFEIVIFTAAMQEYADWILDKIDEDKRWIDHRLYRNHTSLQNNIHIKDLTKWGRPLEKTLIVDNVQENFLFNPENGICIKSWYNDPNDKALKQLTKILIKIYLSNTNDIRKTLKEIRK